MLVLLTLGSLALMLHIADARRVIAEEQIRQPRTPNYSWGEMSDIFAREDELKAEQRKIQLYHKNQSAILNRLSEGSISLHSAATTLDTQARENHSHMHDGLRVCPASSPLP